MGMSKKNAVIDWMKQEWQDNRRSYDEDNLIETFQDNDRYTDDEKKEILLTAKNELAMAAAGEFGLWTGDKDNPIELWVMDALNMIVGGPRL